MKVAIIGLGNQNLSDHIPALLRRGDVKVSYVCDTDENSYKNFKSLFPTLAKSAGYLKNFKDLPTSDIDFCVVSVPHDNYPKIIEFLCKQKIPFMKEKPLARDMKEAIEIVKIKDFEKYCFICTQRRFSPLYLKAKKMISKIGTPFMFNVIYELNISDPAKGWRGSDKIAGGGCILDMGYHVIDQLIWWFGKPDHFFAAKSSLANSKLSNEYAEDSASISFSYNSGFHGTIILSRSAGEKTEVYNLHGSNKHLEGNKRYLKIKDKVGNVIHDESENEAVMMDNQLAFFLKRVSGNTGFSKVIEANLKNMEFIQGLYHKANNLN